MNQLTIILVLVLASTNASKYLHPIHHFQQKDRYQDTIELSNPFEDEQSAVKLTPLGELDGWDSVPDPRMYVLTELESPGGISQEELKVKRKGPSLSIVNPLDVLRQRLLLETARRQKAESKGKIQKNRQYLSTVGKRSPFPENNDLEEFVDDSQEKDRLTRFSFSVEPNPTTRRYQKWKNDLSYQT